MDGLGFGEGYYRGITEVLGGSLDEGVRLSSFTLQQSKQSIDALTLHLYGLLLAFCDHAELVRFVEFRLEEGHWKTARKCRQTLA